MHFHPRRNGFTLVELLVSMAVIGIFLGIALPAVSGALEGARASDAKSGLLTSVMSAVSRAGITGRHVVLCPSSDGNACDSGPDWTQGWIVFVDRDENREREPDETLVFRQNRLAGKVRLRSTEGRTRIVFQANGGNAGSNVTFTLCDGRGRARAESIVLNNRGRLRYGAPSETATAATCPGGG